MKHNVIPNVSTLPKACKAGDSGLSVPRLLAASRKLRHRVKLRRK